MEVGNLFDLFCSTCEATGLHQHRNALYEWLTDDWTDGNAEWYPKLDRIARGAFTEYCKTLREPGVVTLMMATDDAIDMQEPVEGV